MNVLISGKAGLAALITGDDASLVDYSGNTVRECHYNTAANQFRAYNDTLFIESTTRKSAIKKLKFESDKSDALLMMLTLLDSSIDEDSKDEIIQILDNILSRQEVLSYIQGVFYSRPLEKNTIKLPLRIRVSKNSTTQNFINELLSSQDKIVLIYKTWSEIAQSHQVGHSDLSYLEGVFVNSQLAYHLCQKSIEKATISHLKFECISRLNTINDSRQIITKLFSVIEQEVTESLVSVNKPETKPKKINQVKNKPVQVHGIYQGVTAQLEKIKSLLLKNDKEHALKFASELVQSQLDRGDNSYAAMTLCQLSEEAKNLDDYSLQLEWARRATEIEPQDARSHGHLAEAYLNLNNLADAYNSFNDSSRIENTAYAKSGLARIARVRYDYDTAFTLIEESIQIERNFRSLWLQAELYRDVGSLDKSLEKYGQLIDDFPEESSAKCGYAAVLTDQGKYTLAEKHYRESVKLYPDDKVSATGLGFLLARKGKFEEAIKYLNLGISNPGVNNYISEMAKASAMRMKGDVKEAIEIYNKIVNSNKILIDPCLRLISLYSDISDFEKAWELLKKAKRKFENKTKLLLSEAFILKDEERYPEALQLLDRIKQSNPRWLKSLTTRADVLKSMKEFGEAKKQYEEILKINEYSRRAKIGVQLINALEGKFNIFEGDGKKNKSAVVIEDWEQIYINGLVLLAQNKLNKAKITLLTGFSGNPFKLLKDKFSASLIVANDPVFNIYEAKKLLLAA